VRRAGRAHTALAIALVALVPASPLLFWAYTQAAGADRHASVTSNERVFRSLRHVRGATRFAAMTYPVYRWGNEGGLIPVDTYRTEFWLRLPGALPPSAIVRHYRRELRGWHARTRAGNATFTRGGVTVTVDAAETPGRTRTYGV
jgi:hypothetical protein